jgi:methylase of polypeptide subunit release factors
VWLNLLSAEPDGGFDAVIGNPPYVRQELLGDETKRALKADYAAFDGMADLYIYFYEQGLRLLRPGGRMSYVVTNKWLKAGYAEALRNLFATKGQVEFVADFGHAKHFIPRRRRFPFRGRGSQAGARRAWVS